MHQLNPLSLSESSNDMTLTGAKSPTAFSSNLVGGRSRRGVTKYTRGKFRKIYKTFTKRNPRRIRSMRRRAKSMRVGVLTNLLNKFSRKRTPRRMRGGNHTTLDVNRAMASPASIGVPTSCLK
jgi:hypothetical protein